VGNSFYLAVLKIQKISSILVTISKQEVFGYDGPAMATLGRPPLTIDRSTLYVCLNSSSYNDTQIFCVFEKKILVTVSTLRLSPLYGYHTRPVQV
jgi:hypothetical protein